MKPRKNLQLIMALAESEMKQKDLAEKAGVSRAIISMALNGRYVPSPEHMHRIACALDSTAQELFGGEK